MSKRFLTLITLLALLAAFSVAQAQDSGPAPVLPDILLTEAQINADFRLPSTAGRRISNLDVQVKEDGLHVSFQMTVTRDGTSNTLNIIAVLIGLFDRPRVADIQMGDILVTSYTAPTSLQREVTNMLTSSWGSYADGLLADLQLDAMDVNGFIMSDGRVCNPRTMLC